MSLINETVSSLYKKYKTNNPFELCAILGIIIQYADLGDTLGFYMQANRIKMITIHNNLEEYLIRFVCAHELGHAILHPRANTPFLKKNTFFSIDKLEKEANEFATSLLLYDKKLEKYETKFDILREHGIPYEMERFIKKNNHAN
ncbi:ImmA/IrrE family metallo-endopeptidase [Schinkia azotoformans]|uniref:ImmA/IrrE family metallo-endopeptidase n=1 Tax=Schinkia azotoformans TaxID=1454 RepID=UPI002DB5D929|nr:ImmA/IrrE family metallo-endopeptidase [Schinkia azotoformans]MEC1744162.1 ImmA/IrrE family metallo-endopeptidase [Schinkia azotoformans]